MTAQLRGPVAPRCPSRSKHQVHCEEGYQHHPLSDDRQLSPTGAPRFPTPARRILPPATTRRLSTRLQLFGTGTMTMLTMEAAGVRRHRLGGLGRHRAIGDICHSEPNRGEHPPGYFYDHLCDGAGQVRSAARQRQCDVHVRPDVDDGRRHQRQWGRHYVIHGGGRGPGRHHRCVGRPQSGRRHVRRRRPRIWRRPRSRSLLGGERRNSVRLELVRCHRR